MIIIDLYVTFLTFQNPFITIGIFLTPLLVALSFLTDQRPREFECELGLEKLGPPTARLGGRSLAERVLVYKGRARAGVGDT